MQIKQLFLPHQNFTLINQQVQNVVSVFLSNMEIATILNYKNTESKRERERKVNRHFYTYLNLASSLSGHMRNVLEELSVSADLSSCDVRG